MDKTRQVVAVNNPCCVVVGGSAYGADYSRDIGKLLPLCKDRSNGKLKQGDRVLGCSAGTDEVHLSTCLTSDLDQRT